MNFDQIIHKMNMYSISAFQIHDLAVSAKKLMDWDSKSRTVPPYLSNGANRPDLSSKQLSLFLSVSPETSMTIGLILGENNGGKDKNHLMSPEDIVSPEKVIATQSMLYNYCLLEEYEFAQFKKILSEKILDISTDKYSLKEFKSRGFDKLIAGVIYDKQNSYERKPPATRLREWEKYEITPMTEKDTELFVNLSKRRNELTHESSPKSPTLEEAVEFFHRSRIVAKGIAESFNDSTISKCGVPWSDFEPDD